MKLNSNHIAKHILSIQLRSIIYVRYAHTSAIYITLTTQINYRRYMHNTCTDEKCNLLILNQSRNSTDRVHYNACSAHNVTQSLRRVVLHNAKQIPSSVVILQASKNQTAKQGLAPSDILSGLGTERYFVRLWRFAMSCRGLAPSDIVRAWRRAISGQDLAPSDVLSLSQRDNLLKSALSSTCAACGFCCCCCCGCDSVEHTAAAC